MKGECSLGFKNYNNVPAIYRSFNMTRQIIIPFHPLYRPYKISKYCYDSYFLDEEMRHSEGK